MTLLTVGKAIHNPPPADAAPYGVYGADGGQPPGVTQVDNTLATMGRGQWLSRFANRELR